MLTQQLIASERSAKGTDTIVTDVDRSWAVENALDARCSESEDSSDDSYSSDSSVEEDGEREHVDFAVPITPTSTASSAPRRPTSLCINPASDRRASAPSQRSPHSVSSSRSLSSYTCHTPSPRTPSVSMRHDAALRSFHQKRDQESQSDVRSSKPRPAMMDMSALPKVAAPRIEVVQVFDDGEAESAKSVEETAKADRSAARKRMMATLGRGQSKPSASPAARKESRRVPSLDQLSTLFQSKTEEVEVKTPFPNTPGTAAPFHHQRNTSCPTPTTPYGEQYGAVHVMVTPPTPRPQGSGSPTLGVQISRFPGRQSKETSSKSGDRLAPPAFELAPGKQRAMEAQKAQAVAWLASWQTQQEQVHQIYKHQQLILASMQQALPNCYDLLTMGLLGSNATSPGLIPGTPGAPSNAHVQQQRAILAQQEMILNGSPVQSKKKCSVSAPSSPPRSSATLPSPASAKSTWWRAPQSGSESSARQDSASTSSIYSRSSGAYSSELSSPADASPVWRRKEGETMRPERVRSAGSVYVPPGKRAAMMLQQRQQLQSTAA